MMNRFVDIHQHLIYGVDDGPRTMEDMQRMLRKAAEENVGDIICTSHAALGSKPFPADVYLAHMEEANAWCASEGLPLRLHVGSEILYSDLSTRLTVEGHFPSLSNTYTVLVEFSPDVEFKRLCDCARSFGNAGFTVIYAHVERYQAMQNLHHVRELRDEYGVFMQMNSNTVTRRKGFFTERWVRHMLDHGYIDCIGTDAHNTSTRPCSMRLCHEMLRQRYGQEYADSLCGGFARGILGLPNDAQ